ncbi:MAG: 4-(cytidine 5'-diphospho)-2-C-methyl-D-erythritol kinase, partial [Lentimicrobium sp.]|nr:4-(cytidine 5'-diphospho)-2-C-methyl-D-erythritol kinase [Lentimicrobium sp.]
KPPFSVSTREAYRRIFPSGPGFNLNNLSSHPVEEWNELIENDFEKYIFPLYPELKKLKETLYGLGAVFASMSGSGSSVFGIFDSVPEDLRKIIPEGILFTL